MAQRLTMTDIWEYGEGAEARPEGEVEAAAPPPFPWPPPKDGSIMVAFAETWRAATFEPSDFFARLPRQRGPGPALGYYLTIGVLVAGATLFWDSLALFTTGLGDTALGAELGVEDRVSPLVGFFLTPAILLVTLYVSAGITHLVLTLSGGARHGFGVTVRVFCYAYSPGVFGAVPILGGLVGSIWMVVLLVIGLREAHETDGWRAAVAVLIPVTLLLALMVAGLLLLASLTALGTAGALL